MKPPMPGPWPARGSMMMNGRSAVVDGDVARRNDAQQRVVARPLERARVGEHLGIVVEQHRLAGALVLDPLVAALAQRVPEQQRALRGVDRIADRVLPGLKRVRRAASPRAASPPAASASCSGRCAAFSRLSRSVPTWREISPTRSIVVLRSAMRTPAGMRRRLLRCSIIAEIPGDAARADSRALPRLERARRIQEHGRDGLPAIRREACAYARLRSLRIASSCASAPESSASALATSSAEDLFCIASSAARFASIAAFSSRSFARIAVSARTVT